MKTEKFIFLKKKKTRRRKRIAFSLSVSASACFVSFQEVDESVIAVVKSQSEIGWEKTTKPHRNEGIDRGERERERERLASNPTVRSEAPPSILFSPRFQLPSPGENDPGHRPPASGRGPGKTTPALAGPRAPGRGGSGAAGA